jgi:hypothetical protein
MYEDLMDAVCSRDFHQAPISTSYSLSPYQTKNPALITNEPHRNDNNIIMFSPTFETPIAIGEASSKDFSSKETMSLKANSSKVRHL